MSRRGLLAFEESELKARPGWQTVLRQTAVLPWRQWFIYRRCVAELREPLRRIAEQRGWGAADLAKRERQARKLVRRYLNNVVRVAQFQRLRAAGLPCGTWPMCLSSTCLSSARWCTCLRCTLTEGGGPCRHGWHASNRSAWHCCWCWRSAPVAAQGIESVLNPGKVIEGHAKWEDDCKQCHIRFDRNAQDRLCMACHEKVGQDVRDKVGLHGRQKPQACRSCHTDHKGRTAKIAEFDKQRFEHTVTDFALRGKHLKTECTACHEPTRKYREAPLECNACHRKDDVHKGSLGAQCAGLPHRDQLERSQVRPRQDPFCADRQAHRHPLRRLPQGQELQGNAARLRGLPQAGR